VAAERRRTQPSALKRELSGDLDWITMRALEKERDRRYGSVAELAADVRHYLAREPLVAGPRSRWYAATAAAAARPSSISPPSSSPRACAELAQMPA